MTENIRQIVELEKRIKSELKLSQEESSVDLLKKAKELSQETETAKERLIKYFVESINEMKSRTSAYTIIHEEIRRNQNFIK